MVESVAKGVSGVRGVKTTDVFYGVVMWMDEEPETLINGLHNSARVCL